jgi:sucrose-6-phosphate hydrolase SacC (GH32 family)
MYQAPLYQELHRPQFHFTPARNWTNDPNGLVYYDGEYHLCFQLNARGLRWGPNTWGHAVSPDLVHWRQLAPAIEPDEYGWIWSGSAVVDHGNTSGLRQGPHETLVAIYTTGGYGSPRNPTVQAIAHSHDRGRTWTKYAGNPVLGHQRADNRDPKVVWHQPTGRWIMALYLDGSDFGLFGSPNLTRWEPLSQVTLPSGECPDFFELPVAGQPGESRWVFWGGGGLYLLGHFDGTRFQPDGEPLRCEQGANGYAAQTWSDAPDGRRVQISWMAGGQYPSMPFNQQMSFPVQLSLRPTAAGLRLCRQPVPELGLLHDTPYEYRDETLAPGHNLIPPSRHDLFRLTGEVELRDASAFGLIVRGVTLRYDVAAGGFTWKERQVPAAPADGRLRFELLVDRTSLELFAADGLVSASFCYLPEAWDAPLELFAEGGPVRLVSFAVRELRSAWE